MNIVELAKTHLPGLPWTETTPPIVHPLYAEHAAARATVGPNLCLELVYARHHDWLDSDLTLSIVRAFTSAPDPIPTPSAQRIFSVQPRKCMPDAMADLHHAIEHLPTLLKHIYAARLYHFPPGADGLVQWFPNCFLSLSPAPHNTTVTPDATRFVYWMQPVQEYALMFGVNHDLSGMGLAVHRVQYDESGGWLPYGEPIMQCAVDAHTSVRTLLEAIQQDVRDVFEVLDSLAYYFDPRKGKPWHPQNK